MVNRNKGWDDVNLASIPITKLNHRDRRREIDYTWEGTDETGNSKQFFLKVTGGKDGLPDYQAEKVLMALFVVLKDRGHTNYEMETYGYEISQLMRWDKVGGKNYRMIMNSIIELRGVRIQTNAFWSRKDGRYMVADFDILNRVVMDDEKSDADQKVIRITWSEDFLTLVNAINFKPLNLDLYYRLPTPSSMRLMRWADSQFAQNEGTEDEGVARCDVVKLAHAHLGATPNKKYPSQCLQLIEPAAEALQEFNFADFEVRESNTPSGKEIILTRCETGVLSEEQKKISEALQTRSISEVRARRLATQQPVKLTWIIINKYDEGRRNGDIKSPGWLVNAIEEGYTWSHPSPAQQQLFESEDNVVQSPPSSPDLGSQTGPSLEQVSKAVSQLPAQQQERIQEQAIENLSPSDREIYDGLKRPSIREAVLLDHIRSYIKEHHPELLE